jgi:hypothetical protein
LLQSIADAIKRLLGRRAIVPMDDTAQSAPEQQQEGAQEGGSRWERQTAQDALIAARHSGDVEAEAVAYTRYLDGAINASIGLASQVMQSIASGLQAGVTQALTDIGTLAKDAAIDREIRSKDHARLVMWFEDALQGIHEDRERLHDGLQQVLGAVETLGARVGAVEVDLATFQRSQTQFNDSSLTHRTALEANTIRIEAKTDAYHTALDGKINDLQATVEQLPESEQLAVVKKVEQRVARVEANQERMSAQQFRILISMWALALVFVVAILISVAR